MPSLFKTPVSALSGVGPKRAEQFEKLGISSVGELIQFYPRAYEDWSEVTPIADITEEGTYCVKAVVGSAVSNTMLAGGRFICKTTVYDDTGTVKLVFFNNKYISQMLAYGAEYFFYGKITFDSYGSQMVAPAFSPCLPFYRGAEFKDNRGCGAEVAENAARNGRRSAARGYQEEVRPLRTAKGDRGYPFSQNNRRPRVRAQKARHRGACRAQSRNAQPARPQPHAQRREDTRGLLRSVRRAASV